MRAARVHRSLHPFHFLFQTLDFSIAILKTTINVCKVAQNYGGVLRESRMYTGRAERSEQHRPWGLRLADPVLARVVVIELH